MTKTTHGSWAKAAVLGGLAGGAADILTAFVIYRPASPELILQSVASGLLGADAFSGGAGSAAVGLVAHFAIAVVFGAVFVAAALQAPVALRRPVTAGLLYGLTVYGVMNAIVVPLSLAASRPAPPDHMIALGLFAHALFGISMALIVARTLRRPAG